MLADSGGVDFWIDGQLGDEGFQDYLREQEESRYGRGVGR